jgi:membrane-bound lytic murein transglycosylase B
MHFAKFIGIAALFSCIILAGIPGLSLAQSENDERPGKEAYKEELAALSTDFEKDGYNLETLMEDDRFEVYGGIGDRFKNSAERKTPTLEAYKEILGFDKKVEEGLEFLAAHYDQLEKAEEEYDIPKFLITAIIGIESKYGQILGNYNPFNVYVSMMAVDYRADFAEAQLKELLKFVNREKVDVFTLKSSYAGAMSPAQFIPYSVNKWWVGKDIGDMNNSIMSVGNYLSYFNERTGSLSTAVMRYNPSELYRDAILDLADTIEEAHTTENHR